MKTLNINGTKLNIDYQNFKNSITIKGETFLIEDCCYGWKTYNDLGFKETVQDTDTLIVKYKSENKGFKYQKLDVSNLSFSTNQEIDTFLV